MANTKTWSGATLKPCVCGVDDWKQGEDVYNHFNNYERYICQGCGRRIKIELPDG
jgi:hypothetical protein